MHPLETLRNAAKSNWRAALSLMNRLEPHRFGQQNTKIITQREANQFAADLVASIERAVSDAEERKDLFDLLSTAMPSAMRRRWDGQGKRRGLADAMHDLDAKKEAAWERRAQRRRELKARIIKYLPWELIPVLGDYDDVFDDLPETPDDNAARGLSPSAEGTSAAMVAEQKGTGTSRSGMVPLSERGFEPATTRSTSAAAPHDSVTTEAAQNRPAENTVPPPRPYSDPLPAQPRSNLQSPNDLWPIGKSRPSE